MHKVENSLLRIMARENGAELVSIFNKMTGIEHLWQADAQVWPWHAPVLFPVVGRCLNDTIIVDGVEYKMEKHGFARKSTFQLLELSESKMVFSLSANTETRRTYPFEFEFLIGYRLEENKVHVSYEIINRDNKTIYFSLGGHPAFAVPFLTGEHYEDYYLEFEQLEDANRCYIDADGYFDGRQDASLLNTNILNLKSAMFRDDAFIYKDLKSRKVTIRSNKNPRWLSVSFKDFPYLGLWAKVGAPYLCIEPWLGCADTAGEEKPFKEKEGMLSLQTASEFGASFVIEVG